MLHSTQQQCNIETCLDCRPIFGSVWRRTTETRPETVELTSEAAEAAVGHTPWINVACGVYRTHNLRAQAVTTSRVSQELKILDSIFGSAAEAAVGHTPWINVACGVYRTHNLRAQAVTTSRVSQELNILDSIFWQVNVKAFAVSDPTVLYLLVTANRHVMAFSSIDVMQQKILPNSQFTTAKHGGTQTLSSPHYNT